MILPVISHGGNINNERTRKGNVKVVVSDFAQKNMLIDVPFALSLLFNPLSWSHTNQEVLEQQAAV